MSDPYCVAMVLCDAVHIDPGTQKRTILGTFSTVSAQSYPARVNLGVYYGITDVDSGDMELTFRIVDSKHLFDEDNEPVATVTFPVSSPDRLAVLEGIIQVGNLHLPAAGVYHCELLHRGEVLMSRRLVAVMISPTEIEQ